VTASLFPGQPIKLLIVQQVPIGAGGTVKLLQDKSIMVTFSLPNTVYLNKQNMAKIPKKEQ